MSTAFDMDAIRRAYRDDTFFWSLLRERTRSVLDEAVDHEWFAGSTEPAALVLLGTLVRLVQPRKVLQLGTHIGFSAVYLADTLAQNSAPGHFWAVEPDEVALPVARSLVADAGLDDVVTFIQGFSTDVPTATRIASSGPFELIYVDSSHAYAATLEELDLMFEREWVAEGGMVVFHDAALYAASFDPTGSGGVRRALDEWSDKHHPDFRLQVLEPPFWPSGCGLGLLARRPG